MLISISQAVDYLIINYMYVCEGASYEKSELRLWVLQQYLCSSGRTQSGMDQRLLQACIGTNQYESLLAEDQMKHLTIEDASKVLYAMTLAAMRPIDRFPARDDRRCV